MKTKVLFAFILGIGLSLGFMMSCDTGTNGGDDKDEKELTFVNHSWVIESIDPSFWIDTPPSGQMFISISVEYSEDYEISDFTSITLTDPDGVYWSSPIDENNLDTAVKTIYKNRCYISEQPYSMKLGDWTVDVEMSDGSVSTRTIQVTDPGSNEEPLNEYVSSQATDFFSEILAVSRAGITAATKNASNEISITFSASDSRIRNGVLWFYDSDGDYLGSTGYFRDSAGTLQNGFLNTFAIDGSPCTVTLTQAIVNAGNFTFDKTTILTQTSKVIIVTTDGAQYTPPYTNHDYRSIGIKTNLTSIP